MKAITEIIGDNVKRYREEKGWTQRKLGDLALSRVTYIKQIEEGNKNMSVQTLENLAVALEVKVIDLVEDWEDEE